MKRSGVQLAVLPIVAGACLALGAWSQGTMGAAGITIFAEANYRGANANFRAEMPDLRKVGMNDRVDSIRIGRGEFWEVCEDINFKGRCQVFSGDEADLGRVSWGGLISSLRPVREAGRRGAYPAPPPRPHLVIFEGPNFQGESIALFEGAPTLRGTATRHGSVKVYGGVWQICDGADFWGRCEMVSANVPDLARLGFRERIGSVRMRPR